MPGVMQHMRSEKVRRATSQRSARSGAALAMNLPAEMRDVLRALWPCPCVGRPCAVLERGTSLSGRRRHLSASHCGSGPERLVWRTRTRLVRIARLRNGSSVLVYPSGEFVRNLAALCARLFHLHRSVPVAQRIQCGSPACRARTAARARSACAPRMRRCRRRSPRTEIRVRESEARLSALAGSTDEVVFEFDGNGKYLNIWTRNEAMLFRPRHELIGRTLAEVFDEGWARHHVERLRRVLASGTPEI